MSYSDTKQVQDVKITDVDFEDGVLKGAFNHNGEQHNFEISVNDSGICINEHDNRSSGFFITNDVLLNEAIRAEVLSEVHELLKEDLEAYRDGLVDKAREAGFRITNDNAGNILVSNELDGDFTPVNSRIFTRDVNTLTMLCRNDLELIREAFGE